MPINAQLLPEFDQEMANTRKALERIPEDRLGWKPHEKSGTLGWLASHLATIPHWGTVTMREDSFDVAGEMGPQPEARSLQEVLGQFDAHVKEAREALAAAADEQFQAVWTLRRGQEVIFAMPRLAVFRGMILNHLIHHRGQLTVYLRLAGAPVPALYGPSADEA